LESEIKRLPPFVEEIIIVSNRSTDKTVEVAKGLGLKTIVDDRAKNGIGYGYAHMTGLAAATGDIIITADADGTYPIDKLTDLIDFMLDNDLDFVSCNRYPLKERDQIGWILQSGVKMLNLEVKALYNTSIKDILSGMWLMNSKTKELLNLTEGDWNLSPQIKINAALNKNIKFSEHHIRVNNRLGRTKQQYLKTGLSHMYWIAKNKLRNVKDTPTNI
jgi:glycosyltransferase involved in cell wall biosynthesis